MTEFPASHELERSQCNLLPLDLNNPYRYVSVKGDARVEVDPDYALPGRVGATHGGAGLRVHDRPGEGRVAVTSSR
jgi:hypothetical protein